MTQNQFIFYIYYIMFNKQIRFYHRLYKQFRNTSFKILELTHFISIYIVIVCRKKNSIQFGVYVYIFYNIKLKL